MSDIEIPPGGGSPAGIINPGDPDAPSSTSFDGGEPTTDTISSDQGLNSGPPLTFALSSTTDFIEIPVPRIDLNSWTNNLYTQLRNSRQDLGDIETRDQVLYKGMTRAAIVSAEYLSSLRTLLKEQGNQWVNLINTQNSQINTMNNAINTYNTTVSTTQPLPNSDVTETQSMNAAIDAYNVAIPPTGDAAFNLAATQYNAYIGGRNTTLGPALANYNNAVATYNSQVDANNMTIAQLNQGRALLGVPLIPFQTHIAPATPFPGQALAPLPLPVPHLPIPAPIGIIPGITGPSSTDQVMSAYYTPVAEAYQEGIDEEQKIIASAKFWITYQYFFLQGRVRSSPNAYVLNKPAITLGSETGGAPSGSGVGLAQLILGISGKPLGSALSNMVTGEQSLVNNAPLTGNEFNSLAYFGLTLLARTGLRSGTGAVHLLIDKLAYIDIRSSPIAMALNLENINGIIEVVKGDYLFKLIKEQIGKTYGFTGEGLEKVSRFLASAQNLQLLQFALFDTAITLGTPGIAPQLLGLAVGTETVQAIIDERQNPIDIAQDNPIAFYQAKQQAAETLLGKRLLDDANSIIDQLKAERFADEVLNNVYRRQGIDAQSLRSELIIAFRERGIAEADAVEAAYAASVYLERELGASYLNAELVRSRVSSDFVARSIQQRAIANDIVLNEIELQDAIDQDLLARDLRTNRDLRDGLSRIILYLQGLSALEAFGLSNQAVLDLAASVEYQLAEPGLHVQLSEAQISANLNSIVVNALKSSLGLSAAQELAAQFVGAVVGAGEETKAGSILNQIKDQIENIRELKADAVEEILHQTLYAFINPNIPVIQINHDNNILAYTYLKTMWTGLMYADNMPTNFKASIDVPI